MDIENKICEAIEMIVDNSISKADFDRTIQATILSCTNALTKEYKIKYQDNILTAYANGDVNYKKDTLVYVLVPNNDLSKQKTILGAVNKNQESYSTVVNQDQTYDFIGINAIKNDQLTLNSYHTETKILYDYQNNSEENLISVNNFVIEEYIKQNNTIYCSANFQTSLSLEQQKYGNYGIIFALDFLDNQSQIITKYYSININNMSGNPYKLLQPTKQYSFFNIDNENFLRLNFISIFVKNFPEQDENNQIDDIFITNICLQAANKMTSEELTGYSINLNTPNGAIFTEDSISESFLPINAIVKLKGQEIDANDSIEFYWFIEDASIKNNSEYYNIYGGLGWKCLNEFQILDNETIYWIPAKNNINIKIADAIARNNIFKCVAVYSGNIFNKTINIKNYLASNITIVSNLGTTFNYDQENPILSCLIDGEEYPGYIYTWLQIDENGITEIDNTYYQYEVNIGQLNQYATFKCSAKKNDISLGTSSITLVRKEDSDQQYYLTIINGNQIFKYDENGISPTSQSNDIPLKLEPLKLQLNQQGVGQISDDILKNLEIEWKVPEKDTLLVIKENNLNSIELSYDIASNYSYQKTNNQISVTVNYQGNIINANTNFLFLKDGDPGTNGTNFVCKIVPNVKENSSIPDRIIYNTTQGRLNYTPLGSSNQWVKAQLWENGNLIFDGVRSNNNITVKWSVLKNKYDYSTSDFSNLSIIEDSGLITCSNYISNQQDAANIIKVNIEYEGASYCAYMPITLVSLKNLSYNINIEDYTGYKFVTYSSDGKNPKYDSSNPFIIHTFMNDTDVSLNNNISYIWNIKGSVYQDGNWVNILLLSKIEDISLDRNEANFKPSSSYDGQCVNISIECIINLNNIEVGRLLIPIYFGLNRYGLSALNGWDGNTIQTSAEGGFILSPQVGAGKKEEDNSFTGIVIGEVKEGSSSQSDTGLFGYYSGQRSIFLDAKTGTAEFGVRNQGQIIIDPTEGNALIRSGNYQKGQSGMAIDLTTPEIIYGNGNFSVNSEGELNAAIGTLGASNSSKIHIGGTSSNSYIYSGNKDSFTANSTGFYLGTDGFSMGTSSGGQSAFQIDTSGNVDAASLTIQNASTSSARIELSAGASYSQITFYRNNSNKGYIYGGSSGIEIYGNNSLNISGNSMIIAANTMDISSNTLYIRSSRLYARNSSGSVAPAINGTYSLLTKTGCYVGGIGPVLIWYNSKVNLTFYNGILVDTSESEDGDYNEN